MTFQTLGTEPDSVSVFDVHDAAMVLITMLNSTTGTITFELTRDGTDWESAPTRNIPLDRWTSGEPLTPTVGMAYRIPTVGIRQIRLRTISTLGATVSHRLTVTARQRVRHSADDLADWAWTIIANAGGGNWDNESGEWRDAAALWRDAYHSHLDQTL